MTLWRSAKSPTGGAWPKGEGPRLRRRKEMRTRGRRRKKRSRQRKVWRIKGEKGLKMPEKEKTKTSKRNRKE